MTTLSLLRPHVLLLLLLLLAIHWQHALCGSDLLSASIDGNIKGVKKALEQGADVNTRIRDGSSALHLAALHNRASVVELLLEHKAEVNLVNNEGRTPLHVAANAGYTEVAAILLGRAPRIWLLYLLFLVCVCVCAEHSKRE
jgi:ankyrin repeat protein